MRKLDQTNQHAELDISSGNVSIETQAYSGAFEWSREDDYDPKTRNPLKGLFS
jgi:hypothetical protein